MSWHFGPGLSAQKAGKLQFQSDHSGRSFAKRRLRMTVLLGVLRKQGRCRDYTARPFGRATLFNSLSCESLHCGSLVVLHIEDRIKLRDLQQIMNLLRKV